MFYLKNDDMEELFRKAAENYELDTGKASDWESISKKLVAPQADTTIENGQKKKKRRFIFWWFLLFPAGWMAHNTWYKIERSSFQKQPVILQQQVIKADNTDNLSGISLQKQAGGGQKEQPGDAAIDEAGKSSPAPKTTETSEEVFQEQVANPASVSGKPLTGKAHNNKVHTNTKKVVGERRGEEPTFNSNDNVQALKVEGVESRNIPGEQKQNKVSLAMYPGEHRFEQLSLQTVDQKKWVLPGLVTIKQLELKSVAENPELNQLSDAVSKVQVKSATIPKDQYFYAQAIVAPDLTSVKFQRISGTGSSVGLLLGYRFNRRFHVEAGGYWEKKVYYTSGEYFDKSKLAYFQNHEIYDVDGNCHMITIPVNLRYNFISKKNSDWFVTGGATAYLMQKEYYDITYDYYGERRTRGYTYKDAPKSWLATVNIGVGYQSAFWRSFNFRVEPYFRIPVASVGTGNLSLNSAGIYIGIGRKF